MSEAQSYANLAAAHSCWGMLSATEEQQRRILVEPRALDSYYNVLFSLLLFWQTQGYRWPERLTIVSHAFKRERLVDLHCAAIGFPADRVGYIGINPPPELLDNNAAAQQGIREAVAHWRADPDGSGALLAGKRRRRNPHGVSQTLFADSPSDLMRSGLSARSIPAAASECRWKEEGLAPDSARPWAAILPSTSHR